MGFNSTMVIMNDALGQIKADKDFGEKVYDAVLKCVDEYEPVDISSGNHCNAATVIDSHHADHYVAMIVGGNYAQVLSPYAGHYNLDIKNKEDVKTLLRKIAEYINLKLAISDKRHDN